MLCGKHSGENIWELFCVFHKRKIDADLYFQASKSIVNVSYNIPYDYLYALIL